VARAIDADCGNNAQVEYSIIGGNEMSKKKYSDHFLIVSYLQIHLVLTAAVVKLQSTVC